LAAELEHVPTQKDMDTEGGYSRRPYLTEFDGWNAALKAADMDLNKPHDIEFPTKTCPECGDEFPVKPSEYDSRVYCSEPCRESGYSHRYTGEDNPHPNAGERVKLVCEWCGDNFEVYPSEEKTSRFCCPECLGNHHREVRSGENHPRYRGGDTPSYGSMWPDKRLQRLKMDDFTCQVCGTSDNLVVHHRTPFREFVNEDNTVDYEHAHKMHNLVSLCRYCHSQVESGKISVSATD